MIELRLNDGRILTGREQGMGEDQTIIVLDAGQLLNLSKTPGKVVHLPGQIRPAGYRWPAELPGKQLKANSTWLRLAA